jgi:hypothetical protein
MVSWLEELDRRERPCPNPTDPRTRTPRKNSDVSSRTAVHRRHHAPDEFRSSADQRSRSQPCDHSSATASKPATYALRCVDHTCPIYPEFKVARNKKPQFRGLTWGSPWSRLRDSNPRPDSVGEVAECWCGTLVTLAHQGWVWPVLGADCVTAGGCGGRSRRIRLRWLGGCILGVPMRCGSGTLWVRCSLMRTSLRASSRACTPRSGSRVCHRHSCWSCVLNMKGSWS